eukprot:1606497-Lingulodinium_polyedra.AAC.1
MHSLSVRPSGCVLEPFHGKNSPLARAPSLIGLGSALVSMQQGHRRIFMKRTAPRITGPLSTSSPDEPDERADLEDLEDEATEEVSIAAALRVGCWGAWPSLWLRGRPPAGQQRSTDCTKQKLTTCPLGDLYLSWR